MELLQVQAHRFIMWSEYFSYTQEASVYRSFYFHFYFFFMYLTSKLYPYYHYLPAVLNLFNRFEALLCAAFC